MAKKTTRRKAPPQQSPPVRPEAECEEIGRELASLTHEPPPETIHDLATGAGLAARYRTLSKTEREAFLKELAQDREAATTVARLNPYLRTRDSRLTAMVNRLNALIARIRTSDPKTRTRHLEVVRLVDEEGFVDEKGKPDCKRLIKHFETVDPEWKGRKGKMKKGDGQRLTPKAIKNAYKEGKKVLAEGADEHA